MDGQFFISLVLNELVLGRQRIGILSPRGRPATSPLKSRRQVEQYEAAGMRQRDEDGTARTTWCKGWFVGDFEPPSLRSDACEVAVRHYVAGDREALHHHRVATEVTPSGGRVRMCGRVLGPGDIVVLAPGEATAFEAITDAVNVVVKLPSARDDKYPGP